MDEFRPTNPGIRSRIIGVGPTTSLVMHPDPNRIGLHRWRNLFQAGLIFVGLAIVLAIPGWVLAGWTGVVWSLVVVALALVVAGRVPARLILARSGAGLVGPGQAPGLYRLLDELYRRAGIECRPLLFLVPGPELNAFAVGDRRDGGIAVTDGLLRTLDWRELAGVLAHEVSHLANHDTRVMALASAMSQLTLFGAVFIQVLILLSLPWIMTGEITMPWLILLLTALAPWLSTLLQLGLSRNREYTADLEAVALTGDARGLASALKKLEYFNGSWLRSLFGGRPPRILPWLKTHPSTSERIRRLLELESRPQPAARLDIPEPRAVIRQRPRPSSRSYWIWPGW